MASTAVSSVKRATPQGIVRRLLRKGKPSDDAIIASVNRGLPPSTLDELLQAGLSEEEIAGVIGFSVRTFHRKRHRRMPLDVAEGDRAVRLARTLSEADLYVGARDRALHWLRTKNWSLGDRTPLELLATEPGAEMVRQALTTIAYGGVA